MTSRADEAVALVSLWKGRKPAVSAKTWFQTAFDQKSILLLRTRNCCCVSFRAKPSCESATKPPLVYLGLLQ